MKRIAVSGFLFLAICLPPGFAATPVFPPAVEYRITAELDPETKTIEGRQRLLWRNPTDDAVPELCFHMYLNAFKNNRSTFWRESRGLPWSERRSFEPEDWGSIDLLSVRTKDGENLKRSARFIQPDGNDPSDETVVSLSLPSPVPPRGQISLDITFRAKLPRIVARTGFVRDFHVVAQWFPKLGVYEPAGMRGRRRGGWNCHAFHGNSEFYADFGRYDVTFTVPASYVVGATGKKISEAQKGDRTIHRYVQENVHDFAWTADPRYLVHEFRFDPGRDVPPGWRALAAKELGRPESDLDLRPVAIRLLLQPEHRAARDRYVRSAKAAIAFYGLWYGPYPYETLTIADPPDDGLQAGGMEYPTFFTGLAPRLLLRWPLDQIRLTEVTTIHEFGHQYWYGLVASNEFEEAWLDEGLNTDSEYRAMRLAYGPRERVELPGGLGLDSISLAHGTYASLPNLDPIRRNAWDFSSRHSYGTNSYDKVGLFLGQLRHDLGSETFARAQRAYFEEWSFRHPGTQDFFDVFERVSGRDLSHYRRHLVEGTSRLDWSVVSAKSGPAARDSGLFDRSDGRATYERGRPVRPERTDATPLPRKIRAFDTVVLFANLGEWGHDAQARLVFTDGRGVDRTLPAAARWVRLRVRSSAPLAWAAADPDRHNVWDVNRLNDSKVVETGKGPADTLGNRAAAKYFLGVTYLIGLFTQLLWALG